MTLRTGDTPRDATAPAFVLATRLRPPTWSWVLLYVYAAALLAIGITGDWRLQHEDNGALHTSFARAHLDLGLARTGGHDVFYVPRTGEAFFYGHHPPATSLVLAGAFRLAGTDTPAVARTAAIVLHLLSLTIFVLLLRVHLPPALALLGGVLFATVPMSAFFGRMVNYEAVCLPGVLLQLLGYARYRSGRAGSGAALLALGIVLAGLADWPGFFFAAALGLTEAVAALRGDRDGWRVFVAVGALATAVLVLDLAHLALASGSLQTLLGVLGDTQHAVVATPASLLDAEIAHGRRYFGRAALVASALVALTLALRRGPLVATLDAASFPRVLARWLGASGLAATAYVLAAPSWAIVHAYWSFYFLPFVVTSLVLVLGALAERAARGGRAGLVAALVALVMVGDVANTAVRTLVRRHSSPEPFAIERTRELRRDNLPARSWVESQASAPGPVTTGAAP